MPNPKSTHNLDKIFEALANQHRREIIYLLGLQPHTISHLASIRNLSLPAIYKHIKLLEKANLIIRRKIGKTNVLTLNRKSLQNLQVWLAQYQPYWGHKDESLENYAKFVKERKAMKGGEKK
jgi:DNA-binding transcriptional ArsR family regulator